MGASATITSPGSISVLHTRSITCWPPVVTITSDGSTSVPSCAITSTMQPTVAAIPSVGPYWSARAVDSAATSAISFAYSCGENVLVSGSPPASEITSVRSVSAIISRIAELFMPRVRAANSAS